MHNHFSLLIMQSFLQTPMKHLWIATSLYIHSLGTYRLLSHQRLQGLPQPHTLILLVEYHLGQHTHDLYQNPQIQYTQRS